MAKTTNAENVTPENKGQLVLSYPHEVDKTDNIEDPMYVHSTRFTILSRAKSSTLKGGSLGSSKPIEVAVGSQNLAIEDGMVGRILGVGTGAAAIGTALKEPAAAIGVGLGAAIADLFNLGGDDGGTSIVESTAEKVGELTEKVAKYAGEINPIVRTEKIIKLYTPQSPQEEYAAGWTDVEFGLAGAMANSGQSLVDQIKSIQSGEGEGRERAIRLLTGMSNITQAAGFNFRLQDAIELQTGKIPNPFKQQLFKGMNFRSFAYTFKFIPRNAAELASTYKIISTFREHMHPEQTGDFFIMYPSTFEIEYQYRGATNKWLTKIADCALVNMKVDFGAGGALTTFQNTGGAPTEITVEMQFRELALITREHFNDWDPTEGFDVDSSGGNQGQDAEANNTQDATKEADANIKGDNQ
jgi:hypothetical protein